MAEQEQEQEVVWNKPLLLVAFLLGVLAAVLFVAYDVSMQKKLKGDLVNVLQWRDDFAANRTVTARDVDLLPVRRDRAKDMADKGILTQNDLVLLSGSHVTLSRAVRKRDFVMFSDVMGGTSGDVGVRPRKGMYTVTLRVDPNTAPVGLQVHARVDLNGLLDDRARGTTRSYTILKNVRVLAVGSQTEGDENAYRPGGPGYRPGGRQSYRTVTVEVTRNTARRILEVVDRMRTGKVWISVCPMSDDRAANDPDTPAPGEGEMTPEVLALLGNGPGGGDH